MVILLPWSTTWRCRFYGRNEGDIDSADRVIRTVRIAIWRGDTESAKRMLRGARNIHYACPHGVGREGASLRNIVAEAGFTKGAFYGYYPDKAALFEAMVSEAADGLVGQFKVAQDAHFELIPAGKTSESRELSTEYLRHFVNYIYDYFDEFKLVLCCSDGTKYANYVHDLVVLEVERTEKYYEILRKKGKVIGNVSRELHHIGACREFCLQEHSFDQYF